MNTRTLIRFGYDVLTYLMLPLIALHLLYKSLGDRNYLKRINERFGFNGSPLTEKIIWVHAVSYGEVKAASSLVDRLIKLYPEKQILLTTYTPTGSALIKELFGDTVRHVYLPYDLNGSVLRFFKWANPEISIIIETELWPNFFHYCGKLNVPLVLASACVSDKSIKLYRMLLGLFQEAVSHGIVVGAQTEDEAKKFISMGASKSRTFVTGNIKFDYTLPDGLIKKAIQFKKEFALDREIWVAGSTHKGEEKIILRAHERILETFPDILLIIAPRRPERFQSVLKLIDRNGFSYVSRSQGIPISETTQVILADTLGELPMYYSASSVCFVGGSLFKTGGHNLLEPASLNTPIITGPILYGIEEIANMLQANNALEIIHSSEELCKMVCQLLLDADRHEKMTKAARKVVDKNKGSLEKLIKLIIPLLKS